MFHTVHIKKSRVFLLVGLFLFVSFGAALFTFHHNSAHAAQDLSYYDNEENCKNIGGTWTTQSWGAVTCTPGKPLVDGFSTDQKIKSLLYFRSYQKCLQDNFTSITGNGGTSWFASTGGTTVVPGPYLNGQISGLGGDGRTTCNKMIDLEQKARDLWNIEYDNWLCAAGWLRQNVMSDPSIKGNATEAEKRCTNEDGGSGLFSFYTYNQATKEYQPNGSAGSQTDGKADLAMRVISSKVYGSNTTEPDFSDGMLYQFYRQTFFNTCANGQNWDTGGLTSKPTAELSTEFSLQIVTKDPNDPKKVAPITKWFKYADGYNKGTNVATRNGPWPDMSEVGKTCGEMIGYINNISYITAYKVDTNNELAAGIITDFKPSCLQNASTTDGDCGTPTPTCGSEVTGLGWILCPVIDGLTGLNDAMWGLISGMLQVNPLETSGDSTSIYMAWTVLRNIANVVFVIIFLIMIFSQLSGAGISNYGVKKLLPRLIIGAILVNVSYVIVQIAVDAANILGSSLFDLLKSVTPDTTIVSWDKIVELALAVGGTGAVAAGAIAFVGGVTAAFWLLLPIAVAGALGLLAAVFTLIFRQAVIPILAILAPLAFIAFLLPNTESWYKKWQGLLISMLALYPLAAVLFGGVNFAAKVLVGDGGNFGSMLTGLIVMTLPLFALPFLARQAGPVAGKLGGALSGMASKVRKPLADIANPHAELARNRNMSQPAGRLNFGKRMRQGLSRNARVTKLKTSAYEAQEGAEFNKYVADNSDAIAGDVQGDVAKSHIGAVVASVEAENLKAALQPLVRQLAGMEPKDKTQHLQNEIAAGGSRAAAALHYSASIGDTGFLRTQIANAEAMGGEQGAEQRRQAYEAINANAGAILAKAPDLVKGSGAAFGNVKGADLAGFSKDTAEAYMRHLGTLSGSELSTALAGFNSAIEDITKSADLQSRFSGDTGNELSKRAANLPPEVQAQMYGTAAIKSDGKIR